MTKWNIVKTLILVGLLLFLQVRGILWLSGGSLLLGGLVSSLKCYYYHRPVLGSAFWAAVLSLSLFLLGLFLPNVRLWQLLYI